MGVKMEVGWGLREILMVGWKDFGGCGIQKTKHKQRYTENYNCDKAVSREKYSECGGFKQKIEAECVIYKGMLDSHFTHFTLSSF